MTLADLHGDVVSLALKLEAAIEKSGANKVTAALTLHALAAAWECDFACDATAEQLKAYETVRKAFLDAGERASALLAAEQSKAATTGGAT